MSINFTQGLTNLGGLVAIVLAMLFTSTMTDRSIIALARRNGGVYETEFRIIFVLTMLFGVFGYVGWAGLFIYLFLDTLMLIL